MENKTTGLQNLKEEKKQLITKIESLNSVFMSEYGIKIEFDSFRSEKFIEIAGMQVNEKYISKFNILDTIYTKIRPILPENYRLIVKLKPSCNR